jgi:hypothetical protein
MFEKPHQPLASDSNRTGGEASTHWDRPLAVAAASVFGGSLVFPAIAAFVIDTCSWPKWWGVMDVTIAFFLGCLALTIASFATRKVNSRDEAASYRAYRILIHAILATSAMFALLGDWIVWNNCLNGLAWRFWLLLYCLPPWLALFRGG